MRPSTKSADFLVTYIMQNIPNECDKIIVAPSAYVNDDFLTYIPLPISNEDRDL